MKEEAIKEQKEFNERHGLKPQKQKRKKAVEQTIIEDDNDKKSGPPSPKKQKISSTNGNESVGNGKRNNRSPPQTKKGTNRRKAQIKLPKKAPPKSRKKIADAKPANDAQDADTNVTCGEVNGDEKEETQTEIQTETQTEIQTETQAKIQTETERNTEAQMETETETERTKLNSQSELSDANDRIESEAASSSTDTSTKRGSKKQKNTKAVEPPGSKPPSTVFEYFARFIHTGKPRKAQKAFDKLTKMEEKRIRIDYNEMVEAYVTHLKKYLASIPKAEAVAYVSTSFMLLIFLYFLCDVFFKINVHFFRSKR